MKTPKALLALFILASIFSSPVHTEENYPMPPLFQGEAFKDYEVLKESFYAPPVALKDGSFVVFPLGGSSATQQVNSPKDPPGVGRVFPESSTQHAVQRFPDFRSLMQGETRYGSDYASVVTPQGVWLIGPTVELIRSQKPVLSGMLSRPRYGGIGAVALADGSVLVVGGSGRKDAGSQGISTKVERVFLESAYYGLSEKIRVEALPDVPVKLGSRGSVWANLSGYRLLNIGKSQVMLVGGEYGNHAFIYDVNKRAWKKIKGMKTPRNYPALALLGDGSVWASGGGNNGTEAALTSEIWSANTGEWREGPALPVPMAGHNAVVSADRKLIYLAAGPYPTVLAWQPGTPDVFVAAQPAWQRAGGSVLEMKDGRLAIMRGGHSRFYGESYSRRTRGVTLIKPDKNRQGNRAPVWPMVMNGGLAVRNGVLLAAGGTLHNNFSGSDDDDATKLLERMDLASGKTFSLSPLPIPSLGAQVCWLDAVNVLVYVQEKSERKLQWLGVTNSRTGSRKELPLKDVVIEDYSSGMQLAGCHDGKGWLVSIRGDLMEVDVASNEVRKAPRMLRERRYLKSRVTTAGKVVVTSLDEQEDVVETRVEGCDDCAPSYVGFGSMVPSQHYEVFDPDTGIWTSSAPMKPADGPVALLPDGRMIKLVAPRGVGESAVADSLALSTADGSGWTSVSLPAGLPSVYVSGLRDRRNVVNGLYLLTLGNHQPGLENAVFIGVGKGGGTTDWWWMPDVGIAASVKKQELWKRLPQSIAPWQFPRVELDSGKTTPDGKRIYLMGSANGVVAYVK